jgi:phosphoesterase RecJ-like protein
MTDEISALKQIVSTTKKAIILAHKSPDGDAVGSSIAWNVFLKKLNIETLVVFPDQPAPFLLPFLEGVEVLYFDKDNEAIKEFATEGATLFCLDFNTESRVGAEAEAWISNYSGKRVMLDHHPFPSDFCDVTISRTKVCSTAQLVYECIEEMGCLELMDSNLGQGIYLGIMTDTGSFRYPSVNAKTHLILAHLMQLGLQHFKIHEAIFDVNTIDRLQLRGFAIAEKLVCIPGKPIAYMSMTKEELVRFNYQKGDTEGLVNVILSIEGFSIAAFFMETNDGVKISFRSKGDYFVNEFSSRNFQGGGHQYAAGGFSPDSLEKTLERFESLIGELA